jgi:hypothetical protein
MAMVVVLFAANEKTPSLDTLALECLSDLGVTSVTLLRDGTTAGLVLEGWALDPSRAAEAASTVTGPRDRARALYQVAQMSVTTRRTGEADITAQRKEFDEEARP